MEPGACQPPVIPRIQTTAPRMTMVRTKVAKSEPTFSTPILANIAVSAANVADRIAQNCQERSAGFMKLCAGKTACVFADGTKDHGHQLCSFEIGKGTLTP